MYAFQGKRAMLKGTWYMYTWYIYVFHMIYGFPLFHKGDNFCEVLFA